ncbi:MAG: serine hydrolase domain-containing protein [Christensenellaceae bacterium]|nr:serine hydrolase domain-containing protein [Christensenellaceae bacterium]MEA5068446.1 serine hydrolase domain-containing protein [Christensenellaceae bacterium]
MRQLRLAIACLLAALTALLPLTGCAAAESPAVAAARAFARLEVWRSITSGATGSATVAVMDGGITVYAEGFGMADREGGVPVDKDTLFNMGSVSKVYVATAIMLLVDDGAVSLDAPAADYLPEFTMADARYKDITVRMLLNHTSGLPGTLGPSGFGYRYNEDFYEDVLDALAQSHLKHRPGALNPYCNDGFTLAEMIVAKVSGMSYLDFLGQRIFKPLGLKYTGIGVGERPEKDMTVARAYTPAGVVLPPEVLSLLGTGGLSATAEDICRFVDSFAPGGRHILSDASLAEMNAVQPAELGAKLPGYLSTYGLGWDFAALPDLNNAGFHVLGKSGGTFQYNSMTFIVPEERIAVAVILTGGDAMSLAYKLLKTYMAGKGLMENAPAPIAPPPKTEPVPPELKAYEGYYIGSDGLLRVGIDAAANTLTVYHVAGSEESPAFSSAYGDGCFHGPGRKHRFAAVDGRRYLLAHHALLGGEVIFAEMIEPSKAPQTLGVDVEGRMWLRRNAKAYEEPSPVFLLHSGGISGLPGFVYFDDSVMRITGPTTAGFSVANRRDLYELTLSEQNGVIWARLSDLLYSDADAAPTLKGGAAELTIGDAGYDEWLKVDADAVLSFEKPDQGRILVVRADGAFIYDSITDSGEVFVPADCFVAAAGEPGDIFTVRAR